MNTLPRKFKSTKLDNRRKEAVRLFDKHTFLMYPEITEAIRRIGGDIMNMSPSDVKKTLFPKERIYKETIYIVKEEMDLKKSDKTIDMLLFSDFIKAKQFFEDEKENLIKKMDSLSDEWNIDYETETHFLAEDNCYEQYGEIVLVKKQVY